MNLDASDWGISDIAGLEHCTNLAGLTKLCDLGHTARSAGKLY